MRVCRYLSLVPLVLTIGAGSALGSPILIASTVYTGGVGISPISGPVTQQVFALTYNQSIGTSLSGPKADCVGCDVPLPLGTTGSFDFTAANSAGFSFIASMLTDGVGQVLNSGSFFFGPSNLIAGGGMGGRTELEQFGFGHDPDLIGTNITLIRLNILANTITPSPGSSGNPLTDFAWSLRWDIYGTTTATTPEPSAWLLLGTGLTLVTVRLRIAKRT